ncbi:hypothetical protein D3C76_1143900 [compost metagenome]
MFHDTKVWHCGGKMDVHHCCLVTVEIVRCHVHIKGVCNISNLHRLPNSVPDSIDDRNVHGLTLEIRQILANSEKSFTCCDR